MASKATIRRQKSAQDVIASGKTHKVMIASEMAKAFGEDIIPAVELIIDRTSADLSAKTEAMVAADDAHLAELRDDPSQRTERDNLTDELHDRTVTVRGQLDALFGPEYVTRTGFEGDTPDDAVALLRLVKTVLTNLVEIKPPESRVPGYTFDATVWQKQLSEPLDRLDALVTKVAEEERQAEATLTAKHASISEFDRAFSCTASLISTLLEIAGEDELADRVRPSTRRKGQTNEVARMKNVESA